MQGEFSRKKWDALQEFQSASRPWQDGPYFKAKTLITIATRRSCDVKFNCNYVKLGIPDELDRFQTRIARTSKALSSKTFSSLLGLSTPRIITAVLI
jgi:hypothetical protein